MRGIFTKQISGHETMDLGCNSWVQGNYKQEGKIEGKQENKWEEEDEVASSKHGRKREENKRDQGVFEVIQSINIQVNG